MRRVAVLLVLLLSFAACVKKEKPQPPPPAPPKAESRDGGRLVRRLVSGVNTLNYLLQVSEDERQVLAFLYDPLIDLDRNMQPVPGLAASWEVLDGGRTYVLHLDPRATFSDGKPVRAADVVFTLHKILDEESQVFSGVFADLDRGATKAVDERTVRVVFKNARAGMLLSFHLGVMPEHVYAKEDFGKTKKVVGTGPYVVARRGVDRSILLERREDYWREKPHIQSILFRTIPDDTVASRALRRGDVDVSHISNDNWVHLKDDPEIQQKIEFHTVYQPGYNCIAWNLRDPLLHDVRVRRALAMVYDRQTIIERLYHGQARAVTGPFTADEWANNPEVSPIDYNPTAAAALLASAGWSDSDKDGILDRDGKPFALTLLVPAGAVTGRNEAEVFQQALLGIGVRLQVEPLEDAAFFDYVLGGRYQAAYLSWTNEPDPDPYELFHSSQLPPGGLNIVAYKNEEADALLDEARAELDPGRRADLYHQFHDVLARDQPYLWMVQVAEKWAVHRRVQDVQVAKQLGLFLWYPGPRAWWLRP